MRREYWVNPKFSKRRKQETFQHILNTIQPSIRKWCNKNTSCPLYFRGVFAFTKLINFSVT